MDIKEHILAESKQWHRNSILDGQPVDNVLDFCKIITSFFKQKQNGTWLFRGESHLFDTPLVPSILRKDVERKHTRYPDKIITDLEIEQVEKCRNEVNAGNINDKYLKAFLPIMHDEDINWLPLARHFGFQTRLLDVTTNPLVALYFACSMPHKGAIDEKDDAFVYAFVNTKFRPVSIKNKKQRNSSDFPPIPISFLDLYDVDNQFDQDFDKLPYVLETNIPQQRLVAQSGKFIFWKKMEPVLYERQIIPIRVNAAEKNTILNELSAFGINRESLFPNE